MEIVIKKIKNKDVLNIFESYPKHAREKLLFLRQLIFDTASDTEGVGGVEETIKWGQPSYIVKGGSTVRMDMNNSNSMQYAMYFHCKTKLVDTFKELYSDKLKFEGNRAIIFDINDEVPVGELKHCIALSFTYHVRKKLPMLGV